MTELEVLVIGGGIAGASTAYHLASLGHDVTLVERGDIASESFGGQRRLYWRTRLGPPVAQPPRLPDNGQPGDIQDDAVGPGL